MRKFICNMCEGSFKTSSMAVFRNSICYDCEELLKDERIRKDKVKRKRKAKVESRKENKKKLTKSRRTDLTWLCCANKGCTNHFNHRYGKIYCSPQCWNQPPKYYNKTPYYERVWELTESLDLTNLPNYNKRGWREYHIDHIVPISYGESNNIPVELIASLDNLQMMWWKDNYNKGSELTENSIKILSQWGFDSQLHSANRYNKNKDLRITVKCSTQPSTHMPKTRTYV